VKKLTAILALILLAFAASPNMLWEWWRYQRFEKQICIIMAAFALLAIIATRAGGWIK
jgi:hypothetical protein